MSASPDTGYQPARILIVDDERHNRQLLEVMLAPEGYFILTAASGEEALAIVSQQSPDLILLDIMMPGMDGYQIAARIKGNLATKNIPVIMVTALDDRHARMLGLNSGAEDFLTKPVDRAELCVRVKNLLRLKAYGDHYDKYSRMLEVEVNSRTADLVERTKQAGVLTEQAALLKRSEAELAVLTERLSLAAAVARLGVWDWDLEHDTLTWNATMFDIYGFTPLVPMPYSKWTAAVHPEDLPAVEAALRKAAEEKGEESAEFRIVKADGSVRHVSAVAKVVLDEHANVVRIIGVHIDVTERKEADAVLGRLRSDQMRFKDEFLSHVSHELRSPLTAIKQFTGILLRGLAGELTRKQAEYQQIVLKNVNQLQSMIDDLLEVTRLETGKLTVEPESVSVSNAVTDTFNTLRETAGAKGIALSCELQPDLPRAYADRTRLRQILIILLDNAIKFTPDGGAITVRAGLAPDDAQVVLVEVMDNGIGIGSDMVERVFERLHQVSDRTQSSRKGLGLGLYICRELVTRQGGRIWAARRSEEGSVFSFTLPVFSFHDVIAPLLKNDKWPADTVALIVVETVRAGGWPSKESRDEWCQEARNVLLRCTLPDLDIILPHLNASTRGERFLVAAFADEKGASVLSSRIQEQFERLPTLKQAGMTLSVTCNMLKAASDAGASQENIVTRMATRLEESIHSSTHSEALSS